MANYGWKWSLFPFLDTAATVHVLTASDNDVKTCRSSNCTFSARLKLWSRSERINKLDCDYSYWQMFSWVCSAPEIPRDIAFIPSILKHVKKVYSKRENWLGKLNPNFSSEMKSLAFLLPSVDSGIEKWERETERKPKNEGGGKGRGRKERGSSSISSPPPPRSLTRAIFLAVFDTRSSFLVPKPHGNACYAG